MDWSAGGTIDISLLLNNAGSAFALQPFSLPLLIFSKLFAHLLLRVGFLDTHGASD